MLVMFSAVARAYEVPVEVNQALSRLRLVDGPNLSGNKADIEVVHEYIRNSWRDSLRNINAFSGIRSGESKIIAGAMEALSDEAYLSFCVQALNMYALGQLNEQQAFELLMENEEKNRFIDVNYKEPELSLALRKARLRIQNPTYADYVDTILHGQAAEHAKKFAEGTETTLRKSLAEQRLERTRKPKEPEADRGLTHQSKDQPKVTKATIGSPSSYSLILAIVGLVGGLLFYTVQKLRS